jgi:hypothetical protein
VAETTPLSDVLAEAERVTGAAAGAGVPLRLLGGVAVCLHSESARRPPLRRRYGDLDLAAPARRRADVDRLLQALGYRADTRFNTLNGTHRLLYLDLVNARQVDVFLDAVRMCHVIDLRARLGLAGPCLAPADLLLSKLQIFEINQKDLVDVVALLLDHSVTDHDDEAINGRYVARLAGEDWGLHRTLELNTEKVRATARDLPVDAAQVAARLAQLWDAIEAQPKPLKWRLRARVGDRLSWYELPEEVRQPYEALG